MSTENHDTEPIIDNIILDDSSSLATNENGVELVLFSSLKADTKPVKPYKLGVSGIEYPQIYAPRCAICNSPHRNLLELVYVDCGKKVNTVIKFFEEHFNAKLNWVQVKTHVKYHCDFNKIETPGLLDYEDRDEELSRWKYREYELALIATMAEINDVRGLNCRTPDDVMKRSGVIDKLNNTLIKIKQLRDDTTLGLPNLFEVLLEIHNLMVDEEDKRIIREKVRELKASIG
jgi:hypothetical protein